MTAGQLPALDGRATVERSNLMESSAQTAQSRA